MLLAALAVIVLPKEASANDGYSMCVVPLPMSLGAEELVLDSVSLMVTSTELHRPSKQTVGGDLGSGTAILAPEVPEEAGWEAQFAWGSYHSQEFLDSEEPGITGWVADEGSGAGVPYAMQRAESLLRAAEEAPEEQAKAKIAEQALRLYYHARWLAERNHAMAAEFRY